MYNASYFSPLMYNASYFSPLIHVFDWVTIIRYACMHIVREVVVVLYDWSNFIYTNIAFYLGTAILTSP